MKPPLPSIFAGLIIGGLVGFLFHRHSLPLEAKGEPTPLVQSATMPNFVKVARNLKPAVVNIEALYNRRPTISDFFENPFLAPHSGMERSSGSGVFIDGQGHIVTNYHVIQGAVKLFVTLSDGQRLPAILVGGDHRTDLALLRVQGIHHSYALWGPDSPPEVGSWVVAIGSPLGLDHSVTKGIVSAIGRQGVRIFESAFSFENFIQVDAAINPGNSGGPLLNLKGELVGINTAIASKTGGFQGVGFAIPIQTVKMVVHELIEHGHIRYPWLGAHLADIKELTKRYLQKHGLRPDHKGAVVLKAYKDTPASRARLIENDLITHFNDKEVQSTSHLRFMMSHLRPPAKVSITIRRKNQTLKLELPVEERPPNIREKYKIESSLRIVD